MATKRKTRRSEAATADLWFDSPTGRRRWVSPSNKEEFAALCDLCFGVKLAPKQVCDGHTAPLDAAWDAYSTSSPIIVWEGSRGLAGKTTAMAAVCAVELLDGADVTMLGGSGAQSRRATAAVSRFWERMIPLPGGLLAHSPFHGFVPRPPGQFVARTLYRNTLMALMASQASVRGPHPQRLRMDEVDELDIGILDAALGQPMSKTARAFDAPPEETRMYSPGTLLSSTHQYADGTMSEVIKRARRNGWPYQRFCFHETHVDNGGWLTQEQIDFKRSTIPEYMWIAEFELGEPNPTSRLWLPEALHRVFLPLEPIEDREEVIILDEPRAEATYVVGADWARDQDWTVITVLRTDLAEPRLVAYHRMARISWPAMVYYFDNLIDRFEPTAVCYDATGVGSVVKDLSKHASREGFYGYVLNPKDRVEVLADYVAAFEKGRLLIPPIDTLEREHRYVRPGDLWGGVADAHTPDTVSSVALAWAAHTGKAKKQAIRRGEVRRRSGIRALRRA